MTHPVVVWPEEQRPRRRLRVRADHTNGFVVDCYLDHLRRRLRGDDLSGIHFAACVRDLAEFMAYRPDDCELTMGELRVSETSNADMEEWLLSRKLANATRKRKRNEICACFTWAARDGCLIQPNANPFYRSRTMRLPVQPRREARADEYDALQAAGESLRQICFFIANSGARTCEAREARFTDVDWKERVVELFSNKTYRATGRSRLIGLPPAVFELLQQLHEAAANKTGPIFLNSRSQPWTADALSRSMRRFRRRTNDTGLTPSMFRQFWAGNAEEAGCSDREIATGLGHGGTQLVSWYSQARRRKKNQLRIAEKVAGMQKS